MSEFLARMIARIILDNWDKFLSAYNANGSLEVWLQVELAYMLNSYTPKSTTREENYPRKEELRCDLCYKCPQSINYIELKLNRDADIDQRAGTDFDRLNSWISCGTNGYAIVLSYKLPTRGISSHPKYYFIEGNRYVPSADPFFVPEINFGESAYTLYPTECFYVTVDQVVK